MTKTIKLKDDTLMHNTRPGKGPASITVPAGMEVTYTRTEDAGGVTHLVEYTDSAGTFQAIKTEGNPLPVLPAHTPTTLTNTHGDSLQTSMSDRDACNALADLLAGKEHWLWYYIHKAVQELQAPAPELDKALTLVGHMFLYAIGHGLKRPRIRVAYQDTRFHLYLSKKGTLCIKSAERREPGKNLWHEERYMGCIWQGKFLVAKSQTTFKPIDLTLTENEFLEELANPQPQAVAGFLAKCSKDLGCCAYCNAPLDDPDSKHAGYGPICAKRWGLPHGKDLYTEKAPSFFATYAGDPILQAGMQTILAEPGNVLHWGIVSDRLEEQGLPRMVQPDLKKVTLPKA